MPTEFSIGGAINGLGRQVGKSALLRSTIGRPLVALAIVVIIVAVAMHYSPDNTRDRLLVVASIVAVAWLHYHVRSSEVLENTNTGRARDMFTELQAMPSQGSFSGRGPEQDDDDADDDDDGSDAGGEPGAGENAELAAPGKGAETYPSVVLPGDVSED